jgi:hypothetical protein
LDGRRDVGVGDDDVVRAAGLFAAKSAREKSTVVRLKEGEAKQG